MPASDTVKIAVDPTDEPWIVRQTLPRESVFLAQTPQAFRRHVLAQALALADAATDEAALAERLGEQVRIIRGEASNIKITTADDLAMAEAWLDRRSAPAAVVGRAGTGYDLHRLVAGRPLVVGGVTIPAEKGALGYSDADVVCHAITDAIFGAASLGDIGTHFPDSHPQWKGALSLDLLARAAALIRQHGFEVANVDVTVVLEAPKLRPYVEGMRVAIAQAIGTVPDVISVKAKTNEGVDAIGRGEAIAAHAVVLLTMQSS
jgi:2-C-methyl-D-erythritol 4-phosphate cytidylyltransferase / 2-C-methyl-D-erythritol 2,4-cyclodiphosphate synthase